MDFLLVFIRPECKNFHLMSTFCFHLIFLFLNFLLGMFVYGDSSKKVYIHVYIYIFTRK